METMTAQQAIERLEKYRSMAVFTAGEMDVPENLLSKVHDAELHNACISALNKQIPKAPRKTTIFEGEQAEIAETKGLINFKTYKCPVCNWIVVNKSILGARIKNFCENCGQALDTDITKVQNT